MIATHQATTRSFKFYQALTAVEELTQDELFFLKKELEKNLPKKRILLSSKSSDKQSFFLFGKWSDFDNAEALREKAWKRNSF